MSKHGVGTTVLRRHKETEFTSDSYFQRAKECLKSILKEDDNPKSFPCEISQNVFLRQLYSFFLIRKAVKDEMIFFLHHLCWQASRNCLEQRCKPALNSTRKDMESCTCLDTTIILTEELNCRLRRHKFLRTWNTALHSRLGDMTRQNGKKNLF